MTDTEKKSIEYMDKIVSDCENYWEQLGYTCNLYDGDEPIPVDVYKTVLNLIKKQQAEIKDYGEEYNHWAHKAVTRAIELEKKDKRISDLEFALMDMVLQFADENKDSINTMGLSALETAFNELNFDNPMSIKEVHKRYKELAQKYYK